MDLETDGMTDLRPGSVGWDNMQSERVDSAPMIRDFIARNFLFSENGFHYGDDASFLGEGIIELVPFVEKQFGISVADHELLPGNFDSVRKLTSFIARKQGNGA